MDRTAQKVYHRLAEYGQEANPECLQREVNHLRGVFAESYSRFGVEWDEDFFFMALMQNMPTLKRLVGLPLEVEQ